MVGPAGAQEVAYSAMPLHGGPNHGAPRWVALWSGQPGQEAVLGCPGSHRGRRGQPAAKRRRPTCALPPLLLLQPSQKEFRIKKKLAKKARQNRPIPPWIRFRTNNTIRCAGGREAVGRTCGRSSQ